MRLALLLCVLVSSAVLAQPEAAREIDGLLESHWEKLGVKAAAPAPDEVFLRRVYLDIVGRIPTLEESRAFHEDKAPERRVGLVDRLLGSECHAQHLFHFWADLLRIQSRANGAQGDMTSKPYLEHIKQRIRENVPYDVLVRELLTAQGKVWDNPAIGYYMRDLGMPLDNLANTTRVFLGTRIECAQCHNHPFDKWTQLQFYQMAAFTYPLETNFTGIAEQGTIMDLKRAAEKQPEHATNAKYLGRIFENLGDFVRYSKVQSLPSRVLKLPHDYAYTDAKPHQVIASATMLGKPLGGDLRAFADWMTSPENPRFTKVIANRLWRKVFGQGLIEPVDEFMDTTVASQPTLMNRLERLMVELRYDLRAFLRVLYTTKAYQMEVPERELVAGEAHSFTGPLLRRMTAEQIYDSFVTLIHPTPDLPRRQGIDREMAEKLVYRGKLSDALDLLTPKEIVDGALKAGEGYERISQESKVLRVKYEAAQKAKDKALMEKLNLEIRSLEFTARTGIHDHIVVPAVARLYKQKTQRPAPAPLPVKKPTLEELKKPGQQREYIAVPGYDIDQAIPMQEKSAEDAREAVFKTEAKRFGIADVADFVKARREQAKAWPRAADLESPAPRGHYLREFGQSDRDFIDNANADASMPQALVLMNSELFESILKPNTQLRLNLKSATNSAEQARVAYQTVLSRQPTAAEIATWEKAKMDGLTDIEDLVFALINTQEFLFIQ